MLGDQAQLTNEVISPLEAFGTFKTMHTIITPITSIYRSDNPAIANFQDTFRRRKENEIFYKHMDGDNFCFCVVRSKTGQQRLCENTEV